MRPTCAIEQSEDPLYITRAQAARLACCHVQLVDRWIKEHRISAFKGAGRRVLLRRTDVITLIESTPWSPSPDPSRHKKGGKRV